LFAAFNKKNGKVLSKTFTKPKTLYTFTGTGYLHRNNTLIANKHCRNNKHDKTN